MKSYQDPDPLHGNGKSVPKPNQPNSLPLLPRGNRLGSTDAYKAEYELDRSHYSQCLRRVSFRPVDVKRAERAEKRLAAK